jgi:uncharacterized protein
MPRWMKLSFGAVLCVALIGYIGVCVWFIANESRLVFTRELSFVPPSPYLKLHQRRIQFANSDGSKLCGWIIPSSPEAESNLWMLHFHGSGDNVSLNTNAYDDYRNLGFNILAPEYPGYLDCPGKPSESAVESEAKAAYDYLRTIKGVPPKNIVIFGHSLGSGIAFDLASRVEAAAVIEHEGFSSAVALAKEFYPLLPMGSLMRNRFESDKKISLVKMPILFLHSSEDEVIPLAHAQRLYELARSPKRLAVLRGRHGPVQASPLVNPDFVAEIASFLRKGAGMNVREPRPSIATLMAAVIQSEGIEAAVDGYTRLRAENANAYNFREPELNALGYALLEKKKPKEAIAVLRLNAEQFPDSFNAFDSLGDAYVAAGDHRNAINSYQQSLALFPEAGNYSRIKLDRLRAEKGL